MVAISPVSINCFNRRRSSAMSVPGSSPNSLAMAAPRPFLLIGGDQSEGDGGHSDDLQSWGYFNRAKEVYELLGIAERLQFASTADGHKANGPNIDPAWKTFFQRWLKETPVRFTGWRDQYGPARNR